MPRFSREVDVEAVDVLGARIANEDARVVWGHAAPSPPRPTQKAGEAGQTEEVLRMVFSNLHPVGFGIVDEVVVIDVATIGRPVGIVHVVGVGKPFRPFLGLEIIKHEFV